MASTPLTLQKAELRRALSTDRTLTTVQLQRRGLLHAAVGLPEVTYTCRTRVTQSDSGTDLTFVALTQETLARPPRELMHDAGTAEARHVLRRELPAGATWQPTVAAGRARLRLPDAEVLHGPDARQDWWVEFDAGYAPHEVDAKLEAAARAGYTRLVWATSIHARTRTVPEQATTLHRLHLLPGVLEVTTVFVDFWSWREPYTGRSRCHKPMRTDLTFEGTAGPRAG